MHQRGRLGSRKVSGQGLLRWQGQDLDAFFLKLSMAFENFAVGEIFSHWGQSMDGCLCRSPTAAMITPQSPLPLNFLSVLAAAVLTYQQLILNANGLAGVLKTASQAVIRRCAAIVNAHISVNMLRFPKRRAPWLTA